MNVQGDATPATGPENPTITLRPLLADGPDALSTVGDPNFDDTKLVKLETTNNDRFRQVSTLESTNVLASLAGHPTHHAPMHRGAKATAAKLALHKRTSGATTTAELRPPKTIKVEPPSDTQIVIKWVANSAFNAARNLRQLALLVVLAIGTLLAPAPDALDTDDDDDGDEPEECSHVNHHRPRFHVSRLTIGSDF